MAIGRSMAALVAAARHLLLTLSDIKDGDSVFLLDALLSPSGLFGDTVVIRHQEAGRQVVAFQRFLSRRSLAQGAAGTGAVSKALGRGPRSLSRICGPSFRQRGLRPRSPDAYGSGLMRAGGTVHTAVHGARLSSVPSGDRSANPAAFTCSRAQWSPASTHLSSFHLETYRS